MTGGIIYVFSRLIGRAALFVFIILVMKKAIDQKKGTDRKRNSDTGAVGGSQTERKADIGSGSTAGNPAQKSSGSGYPRKSFSGGAEKSSNTGQTVKPDDVSTMEYLRQKAVEDEKAHEEEARLEAARLSRESGGRLAARRYTDGDSIPKGMHVVTCRYCGAENLIPDNKVQSEYTCCFCREIL